MLAEKARHHRRAAGLASPSLDLNYVGYAIVGLFVLTWVVALAVWRFGADRGALDDVVRPGLSPAPEPGTWALTLRGRPPSTEARILTLRSGAGWASSTLRSPERSNRNPPDGNETSQLG